MSNQQQLCRHCQQTSSDWRRSLCRACYAILDIRCQYQQLSNKPQLANRNTRKPAARATEAMPGTPEKITAMAERLARGESIFHPDDHYRAIEEPWEVPVDKICIHRRDPHGMLSGRPHH